MLLDHKQNEIIASGLYDPDHPLPLRICRTKPPFDLNDDWIAAQLTSACQLRQRLFDDATTGFRLVAGEGDQLPGLIVDIYDNTAVLKLDGGAPEAFYDAAGIARWLVDKGIATNVVHRFRGRGRAGEVLTGHIDEPNIQFVENGLKFVADVLHGQKTGFFLDQRDNRHLLRQLSRGLSVLNLYSFNGGFSIAAGAGGARMVTSVDIAGPAIEASQQLWKANQLEEQLHKGVKADCLDFLGEAIRDKRRWDLVICDPPSFAPSEKAKPNALAAYRKLAQLSARATNSGGLLALASCSSHIDQTTFEEICLEGIGAAKRLPTLLSFRGLPPDHPTPAAMPELRYLKFLLYKLD